MNPLTLSALSLVMSLGLSQAVSANTLSTK